MGVTGLWKLIEPCGKPVPVETLEGKILAVDISIWLHQVVKGFQDNKGSALNNAHLLGLFHRLCKLLYYRVKPVFVFDGCVPQLKRDTIARRQQQRSKLNNEADRIQALLLQSLAKEKVVQQALGANTDLILKATTKRGTTAHRPEDDRDSMYVLPEIPNTSKNADESSDLNNSSLLNDCSNDFTSATEDSSFEESNIRSAYYNNLQSIDVKSQHFKTLPAEVRHEILVDIKETRKQSSWGRLHELPSKKDDFSVFQMKRLLKRRAVQESLEEAQQDMAGVTLSYSELQNFFTEEGILDSDLIEKGSKQICSDEHTRFLLVRDLKKKLSKENPGNEGKIKEEIKEEPDEEMANVDDDKSNIMKSETLKVEEHEGEAKATKSQIKLEDFEGKVAKSENTSGLGKELDYDLEMALALSLEDDQIYNEKDYEYESAKVLKLNSQQRKELKNAAIGPARAYMIEYAGMNDEEVVAIAEETIVEPERDDRLKEFFVDHQLNTSEEGDKNEQQQMSLHVSEDEEETRSDIEDSMDRPTLTLPMSAFASGAAEPKPAENSQDIVLKVSDDSGSDTTDSDFEEVPLASETSAKNLAIVVDLEKELPPDEDLFADIFIDTKAPTTAAAGTSKALAEDLDIDVSESEEMISETPQMFEEKSIFEKYRSPSKPEPVKVRSKSPPILETFKESDGRMLTILEELKKQQESVMQLSLKDIETLQATSSILVSDTEDTEEAAKPAPVDCVKTSEVVEIFDSEDQLKQLISEANKSPHQKTPSKSIKQFFATDYIVKRTPDKAQAAEETPPAKSIASPFFVNRTPKSSKKKSNSGTPPPSSSKKDSKDSKASKVLFPEEVVPEMMSETADLAKEPEPTTEDLIKDMAESLKEQKTEAELMSLAEDLARQRRELENERNRQDRMGMSISQRMNSECQELLRLFGIPYIIAPMEAEAQCAFLDAMQLTNGTITDDSDIWLFGGRTVYKNFFAQNKLVLEFKAEQIEKSFHCDRKKLIQLACLVGSDYTPGIHGIGAVTAMEILASFSANASSKDLQDNNLHLNISTILATLSKFRDWWMANKASYLPPGSSSRLSLFKKLKNIDLYEGFPSVAVVEAYLAPKVDESKESFTWGYPDVESIKEFAKRTFGWTSLKTNDILGPVLKKLNEKKTQATIRNYFQSKGVTNSGAGGSSKAHQLKVSRRIQNAIAQMTGEMLDSPAESVAPEPNAAAAKPKRAPRGKRAAKQAKDEEDASEAAEATEAAFPAEDEQGPSSSKGPARKVPAKRKVSKAKPKPAEAQAETVTHSTAIATTNSSAPTEDASAVPNKKPKRAPRIPDTKQVIPQRQKDLEQLERNKEKAIEILKQSLKNQKKKIL